MRTLKRTLSGLIIISILFSLCGCKQGVKEVSQDDLIAALEKYYDWEEDEEFFVEGAGPLENNMGIGPGYSYDLKSSVVGVGGVNIDDGMNVIVEYYYFESSKDARDYYRMWIIGNDDSEEYLFHIGDEEGDYEVVYWTGKMYLKIVALGEGVDTTKKLLNELGLPTKK